VWRASLSFFELPNEPPPPPEPRRAAPWVAPAEHEFGVSVPVRATIARTEDLAIGLVDLDAFTIGFALRVAIRIRPGAEPFAPGTMSARPERTRRRHADGGSRPELALRRCRRRLGLDARG
jgi:hypothetical protein